MPAGVKIFELAVLGVRPLDDGRKRMCFRFGQIQLSARRQHRIANGLGFKSLSIMPPQKSISGITNRILGIVGTGKPPHARVEYQSMHGFDAPAFFDKRQGQPVQ